MEQRPSARCPSLNHAQGMAVLVAFGLDAWGEPPASWHPVVWFGKLIRLLERGAPQGRLARFLYGIGMLLFAIPCAVLPAALIHHLAEQMSIEASRRRHPLLGLLVFALLEGAALKPLFALRMLAQSGQSVRLALEQQDLPLARERLRSLVSRDCSQLTVEQAGAAAIESLAENVSDSVVAPLLFYWLWGLPGAAVYRLCNTFDAMIGYHGVYEDLGKAAARLDDLLNLLPSRVTAGLIMATAPLWGGRLRRAWKIWRRDARKTASPNAGHPMAAAAGALGLRLEKVGHYVLGDQEKALLPGHIQQAERLVWCIGGIVFALAALASMIREESLWSKR